MKRRVLAMLLLLAMVLSLIPAVGAENAAESTAEHHLLLTDDFTTLGSWTVENQQTAYNQKNLKGRTTYDPTVPGTDAEAKFTVTRAGTYQIWVHAKHGNTSPYGENPWEFKVGVDSDNLNTVFGGAANHANFAWTKGNSMKLTAGEHSLRLIDFSANFARCDAVLVTSDANLTPKEDYTKLQKQLTAQTVTEPKVDHILIRPDNFADSNLGSWTRDAANMAFEQACLKGRISTTAEDKGAAQVSFQAQKTATYQVWVYPKCLLCVENVGYAGTISHPARQNLRVMPVTVNGQPWGFQYSPYVYYNEHAIVMNTEHTPMVIDRSAFDKLFSFVEQFPHYFLGSNADLPIVGGSILAHEHFQGGHHTFPMEKAEKEFGFDVPGFEDVDCCVVKYPMTVLRLNSADKHQLCELAGRILAKWRGYSDPDAMIFAETDGEPHNTITPIARMRNGKYELDLVLRNNLTTPEHPMGLYHPHEELHHIKKENIGLIEVMGLAILPGRLKKEMADLKEALLNGEDLRASETLAKHADWAEEFMGRHPEFNADNAEEILKDEIGQVFAKVLECAGVYKCTAEGREHLKKFLTEVQNG